MSLLWLRVALVLYCIAALTVLPAALYDRRGWTRVAIPATIAAALFHFVSLTETLNAAHHALPPIFAIASHETQSLLALLLVICFLSVYTRWRTVALGIFVLPVAVLLTLVPALRPGQETILLAHSGWIFVHIVLLLAAYAALFLSLLASVLYLIQERRLKAKQPPLRSLPPLETTDQIALKTLLFGLPCMTAGLLIGSALAEQEYGPTFFADPKILLAFAMWFAYCLMIFIRRHSGLRGRRAVYLSSFVFLVVLTVWAANQFSSVHRFTAP
jgi:ABC-type uncharacterized transport system permease subunit